jgi:bla regulator protein blaR1
MTALLTNHLWQSTIFVLAAALVAAALRQNGAEIRHRIWLIASLKFLVPFAVLMNLGNLLGALRPVPVAPVSDAIPDLSMAIDRITQPFTSDVFVSPVAAAAPEINWMPWLIGSVWAIGCGAVIVMRVRGWRRVKAALRKSVPLEVTAPLPVRSSAGLLEPGVVGLWRPVLLVPEGIQRQLTRKQFEAVLLHELCHVKRRDNLTSSLHMLVEAVFWFHPLVWFIGARLLDERERACDEYVLRTAGDPSAYAESILNVCKLYVESPVTCVSGVTGADLKKRIAAIMINRVGIRLNAARKIALMAAAVLAVTLPVAAGMLVAPLRADQSTKFDVVSVKACEPGASGQPRLRTGSVGASPITSPGRLYLQCYSLNTMITEAYLFFADGRAHTLNSTIEVGVEGVEPWMKSERYTIEARTDQTPAAAMMRGPMLQAVLEDRFKLKTHRVSREMPIYELVIAKSGAKVSPYTGTDCVIKDAAAWPPPPPPEGQRYCGDRSRVDGDYVIREGVMALDELVALFNFDRPVVNKTGITAPVSFKVPFAREDSASGEAPRASWVNTLRDHLGLELREAKGPRSFLIIDHAERPTPNPPSPVRQ